MVLTIRHIKARLFKFKSKEDLNINIKEFNNIYQANKEIAYEDKLAYFLVILKKRYFK